MVRFKIFHYIFFSEMNKWNKIKSTECLYFLKFSFIFSETIFSSQKEELYDTAVGYILLCLTILALVTSLLSFGYMYLYLKLNGFIKNILYQMSIVGIVGSLIMIIGEAIVLIKKEQTFTTCSMIHYTGAIVVFMDVFMTAMISGLRYANIILFFRSFGSFSFYFFIFQVLHGLESFRKSIC